LNSAQSQICGKIMLAGEYAVLKGGRALASTISSSLSAEIEHSASTKEFEITSNIWSQPAKITANSQQVIQEPLTECVRDFARDLGIESGGTVQIRSQLNISHGLGSSSAMRLAVAEAMLKASGQSQSDTWQVPELAYRSQLKRQGRASGYDIATQWVGGSVLFRRHDDQPWPGTVRRIPGLSDALNRWVHPLVGGTGAPTGSHVSSMSSWLDQNDCWEQVLAASETLIEELLLLTANTTDLPQSLIMAVKAHRQIFESAPNFPHRVFDELKRLTQFDQSWTAKTTGAGGEDAILIFAAPEQMEFVELAAGELGWQRLSGFFTDTNSQSIENGGWHE
jgi:mevalonate kinase